MINQKGSLNLTLSVIIITVTVGITSYCLFTFSGLNNPFKQRTKTYVNDYYNIKLDIPSDWNIQEDEQVPSAFTLSSPEGQLTIKTPLDYGDGFIKESLTMYKIQLGKYETDRVTYINHENEVVDYTFLHNLPFQKVIYLYFNVGGNFEENNKILLNILKTFEFTRQEPALEDFISFTLPMGWTKTYEHIGLIQDPSSKIFLESPDYTYSVGSGALLTGAILKITRYYMQLSETETEGINRLLPTLNQEKTYDIKPIKIGSREWANMFWCWEGCVDNYYTKQDYYLWEFSFMCANCKSRYDMDSNIHAEDRNKILNSIRFK